jgi:predicted O-methyltransferase YrrM
VLLTIYFSILMMTIIGGVLLTLRDIRRRAIYFDSRLQNHERHIWESHNIFRVVNSKAPLSRPGGWAASADILGELARIVAARRPLFVVELGSGLSTLVLAAALKCNGVGRLVSIDSDVVYAKKTLEQLALHGLSDWAEVRSAGLKETVLEEIERPWYDTATLSDLSDIDLLFIDGPPAVIRKDIRYPSLPWFWNRLNPGAIVLLDDAARPAERAISESWQKSFPQAAYEFLSFEKGALRVTKISQP